MSFSTNWDIEKYRVGYESEEHWELRKKFLESHKNKYPEDKLICLAQVFYNMEFLGCRYPKATMKIVENLSKGIVDDHREKMKGRLKRTFVGASDAASSKVKGLKRSAAAAQTGNDSGIPIKTVPPISMQLTPIAIEPQTQPIQRRFEPATSNPVPKPIEFEPSTQAIQNNSIEELATSKKKKKKKKKSGSKSTPLAQPTLPDIRRNPACVLNSIPKSSPFQDVILYYREHDNARLKLQTTCDFNKIEFQLSSELQDRGLYKSCVKIFGAVIGSGSATTIAVSNEAAANTAMTFMSERCFTILVKNLFVAERKVERCEIIDCQDGSSNSTVAVLDDKAKRMMQMMGWSGGGLGKEEQGRTQPVLPAHQSRRAGVGSKSGRIKFNVLKNIFQNFIQSRSTHDLVFSTDFSNEERGEIHSIAHRFGLKSQSRCKKENRFLTVSKKWAPQVLLSILMEDKNKSEKFELVPPVVDLTA